MPALGRSGSSALPVLSSQTSTCRSHGCPGTPRQDYEAVK